MRHRGDARRRCRRARARRSWCRSRVVDAEPCELRLVEASAGAAPPTMIASTFDSYPSLTSALRATVDEGAGCAAADRAATRRTSRGIARRHDERRLDHRRRRRARHRALARLRTGSPATRASCAACRRRRRRQRAMLDGTAPLRRPAVRRARRASSRRSSAPRPGARRRTARAPHDGGTRRHGGAHDHLAGEERPQHVGGRQPAPSQQRRHARGRGGRRAASARLPVWAARCAISSTSSATGSRLRA